MRISENPKYQNESKQFVRPPQHQAQPSRRGRRSPEEVRMSSDEAAASKQHMSKQNILTIALWLLFVLVLLSLATVVFLPQQSKTEPELGVQQLADTPAPPEQNSPEELPLDASADSAGSPETQTAPLNQTPLSSPVTSLSPTGERTKPQSPAQSPNPVEKQDDSHELLGTKIGGVGFWIQVGAFSSETNAKVLMNKLQSNGLSAEIQTQGSAGKKLYRVRAGIYTSKEEAQRVLLQLKSLDKDFQNSIIVSTEL